MTRNVTFIFVEFIQDFDNAAMKQKPNNTTTTKQKKISRSQLTKMYDIQQWTCINIHFRGRNW